MRIPFNGPAYRLPAQLPQSCQRAVNLFLQVSEKPSKTPNMMVPTPGLLKRATLGVGPVRGQQVAGAYNYVVSGREVYRVSKTFGATLIGTIGTVSGAVSMASNGPQILIIDGTRGYILTVATGVLALITDPDFPLGVTSCTYLDGYFVVCGNGTGQFWICDLFDGSSWVGTEFASAEGGPDNIVACIADHRELWLFGENTTEIFVNTGAAAFPFERTGNAFIEHGCASPGSVAKLENTVLWLGTDDRGEGTIWRASGYTPVRISTDAIEDAIAGYGNISDAIAYTYQDRGQRFYVISFPAGNATWCYDDLAKEWHERAWRNPLDGSLNRHRGQVQAFFARKQVIGDWEDGRLYTFETDLATDDGDTILRLRSTQAAADTENLNVVTYGRMQVDLVGGIGTPTGQGANPLMMMRYSDTGGRTWSNTRHGTMGKIGEYWARCKWERCYPKGATDGRTRVWEVSWSDPVITALLGAVAQAEMGTG